MIKSFLNWLGFGRRNKPRDNIYRGKILYMPKKLNMRTWRGKITYAGQFAGPLPKYFQGKKVKVWILLDKSDDQDGSPYGAIF